MRAEYIIEELVVEMADYNNELTKEKTYKLRNLISGLPSFCSEFFRGIENTTSISTRIAYAQDLKIFFEFLLKEIKYFQNKQLSDITLNDISKLNQTNIEMYIEYLNLYKNEDKEITNSQSGKARKLACLKTFFKYFHRKNKLEKNVTALVDMPKIRQKPIIRLEPNEVVKLLDSVENTENQTIIAQF